MYDVMAIGNALVDHEYVLSDAALEETELTKGNMTLAGIEEQQQLLAYFKLAEIEPSKQAGGGSAANTMFTFASLGGKPFYACRVGDDDQGAFYLRDLHEAGVATSDKSIHTGGVTGSCVVAVTEDDDRIMRPSTLPQPSLTCCLRPSDSELGAPHFSTITHGSTLP